MRANDGWVTDGCHSPLLSRLRWGRLLTAMWHSTLRFVPLEGCEFYRVLLRYRGGGGGGCLFRRCARVHRYEYRWHEGANALKLSAPEYIRRLFAWAERTLAGRAALFLSLSLSLISHFSSLNLCSTCALGLNIVFLSQYGEAEGRRGQRRRREERTPIRHLQNPQDISLSCLSVPHPPHPPVTDPRPTAASLTTVFRRLLRVYAHVYHSHLAAVRYAGAEDEWTRSLAAFYGFTCGSNQVRRFPP